VAKKSKSPARSRSKRSSRPEARRPPPTPVRIARVAKGKKPLYFSDPAIDKLLWMTMTLMEELSVTRDRLDTVERLLAGRKLLRRRDIESYVPRGEAERERSARRAAYVDRMMRAVQAELEEVAGGGKAAATDDDAVAAVSS
jgi:hypothetical protein